ncbi:MAG: hypothetical protein H6726_03275 [Sandaracinaceae bacterium]|nr:hypothetical protein [Sandaracinaceae bacterium]
MGTTTNTCATLTLNAALTMVGYVSADCPVGTVLDDTLDPCVRVVDMGVLDMGMDATPPDLGDDLGRDLGPDLGSCGACGIVAFREYTLSNGETRSESTRIGVAWPSKNGNFSLQLDFIPHRPRQHQDRGDGRGRGQEGRSRPRRHPDLSRRARESTGVIGWAEGAREAPSGRGRRSLA